MFLNWCKWLDLIRGSSHELYVFNVFLTGERLNKLVLYNIMG